MNSFFKVGHRMGLFFVILFAVCFVWFYIQPAERELHIQLLRLSFFYFSKMDLASMFSGIIQSYIWGYIGIGMWGLASKLASFKK